MLRSFAQQANPAPIQLSHCNTYTEETPATARQQLARSTLCGLKAECRKSRSLDLCWITASLLRTAAALQNEYVHNEKRQRLLLCTTQLCWCVAACRMYEYFITCWCRIYLARVLLQYFYLCLLVLWDLLYVSTYAKYYNCNRCCREKLAPPVICNSRQLVRVGGSWTGVVVR